jgi:hypothetical protein
MRSGCDVYWWRWEPCVYSCCSAYAIMFTGKSAILRAAQLWKTRASAKCRLFMWTVLLGRCRTSERRHRHGPCSSVECVFCAQEDEHIDHLFVRCAFSREVWLLVLRRFGWGDLHPDANQRLIDWWLSTRKRVSKLRRRAFDSLAVCVTWSLWLERNNRAFGRGVLYHIR